MFAHESVREREKEGEREKEKKDRESNFDFCNFGATSILPAIITE